MSSSPTRPAAPCCADGCATALRRGEFLEIVGLGAMSALVAAGQVVAGPFEAGDFSQLVPRDKKLQPEWVRSLFERGTPASYRGEELRYIGMPVGGLCAGQLYLGGDGKLWHWDIFNQHVGTGSEHYAAPLQPSSPVEQGFALKVTAAGHSTIRCWTEPALRRFLSGASIPSRPWTIATTRCR